MDDRAYNSILEEVVSSHSVDLYDFSEVFDSLLKVMNLKIVKRSKFAHGDPTELEFKVVNKDYVIPEDFTMESFLKKR